MSKFVCAVALALGCSTVSGLAADLKAPKKAPPPVVSPWDIAFGAAIMSDYNFRGITQSNHRPSAAVGFEPRYNVNPNLQAYAGSPARASTSPTAPPPR